jgi:transposase
MIDWKSGMLMGGGSWGRASDRPFSPPERPLRPYEQRKLHRLKRQKANAVNSRHARIVLLSRGGMANRDIAARVDCSPQWVRKVIHRFNEQGLDGITWYPWLHATGKPRRFTAEVVEEVAEIALCSPKALIGMTRWSLTKLRDYLTEQKPPGHRRPVPNVPGLAGQHQEGSLKDVVGVGAPPQHAPAGVQHHRPVPPKKRGEGRFLPEKDEPPQQVAVGRVRQRLGVYEGKDVPGGRIFPRGGHA